jgi:beta-mannosidase
MSDAVVGYYVDKKLAYRYIKRSQAPFTIAANEIRSWESRIVACNDTLSEKRGHLKIYDVTEKRTRLEIDFTAAPNGCTDIVRIPLYYSDKNLIVFTWELEDGEKGTNHYLSGSPAFSLEQYKQWLKEGWM